MDDIEYIKEVFYRNGFKYVDLIGEGSFATVYLCHCLKYNNLFAIKRVLKHKLADQEINSLVSLIHPYILKLYSTFSDENHHYLVLEYCHNGTLKQKCNLDYSKFVFYAKQILEVLDYCHSQNIAHRDIKPDNIFIDQYNHIKLGDFGLSDHFQAEKSTNQKCGSLIFCSPEMFEMTHYDPFKADIWALGITFFYMVTGRYPYPTCTNEELRLLISTSQINFSRYNIDPSIQSLIMKMTSKNVLFRPSASKLLKFPIFTPKVQSKFSKVFAAPIKKIYKTKKASSISSALASFANATTDTDDELGEQPESGSGGSENLLEKRLKINKIHSLRSCDFFLNVTKNNPKRFVKYD